MKNTIDRLLILIACGLILLLIFKQWNTVDSSNSNQDHPIEKINDSLLRQSAVIDTDITGIEKSVDSLEQNLDQQTEILTHLKTTQNDKAAHIDNASDVELLEFFTSFKTKDSVY